MTGEMTKLDFINECERRRACHFILKGDTFSRKDNIKKAGGIWDKSAKAWLMPTAKSMLQLGAVEVDDHWEIPQKKGSQKPEDSALQQE